MVEWAKRQAAENVRKPTLEQGLRRWWVKKYQLPWTHELFQTAAPSDLLLEFYEDYYTDNPAEARKVMSKDGEIVFTDTGDPLLDKWEQEFTKGAIPDLEEGLSAEEKEKLRKERDRTRRARQMSGQLEFEEDYQKDRPDPRMQSKFVKPDSAEERQIRRTPQVQKQQLLGHGGAADWDDLLLMGD